MKLSAQSSSSILATIRKALEKCMPESAGTIITDIHLQPLSETGELVVYNDDEVELARTVVPDWVDCVSEDFYLNIEQMLKEPLQQLQKDGSLDSLSIMKPYSFVLIDDEKETVAELLLVDDETMVVSDELLKGLDEELNSFLKDLLEK